MRINKRTIGTNYFGTMKISLGYGEYNDRMADLNKGIDTEFEIFDEKNPAKRCKRFLSDMLREWKMFWHPETNKAVNYTAKFLKDIDEEEKRVLAVYHSLSFKRFSIEDYSVKTLAF